MNITLLFGMPRSGTTWAGKILDSHPLTDYRHEPDSVFPIDAPLLPTSHFQQLDHFLGSLPTLIHAKVCGKFPLFPKDGSGSIGHAALKANVLAAKRFGVPVLRSLLPKANTLVWKSIESVGRLGFIAEKHPSVRAILLIRHPCGHVASIIRGSQQGKMNGIDLRHDPGMLRIISESPAGQTCGITPKYLASLSVEEVLAWRWRAFNDHALNTAGHLKNILVLRYEDVCSDPLPAARRIFGFARLDWSSQTANFIRSSTSRSNGSYYATTKDPAQSASKWRTELTDEQRARILDTVSGSAAADFMAI